MRAPRLWTVVTLTAAALVLVGCGGGDDDALVGSSPAPSSSEAGSSSAAPSTGDAEETTAQPTGPVVEVPAEYGGIAMPLPDGASVASTTVDENAQAYVVVLSGVTGQVAYEFYREAFPAAGYEVDIDVPQATVLQAEDADGDDVGFGGFLDQVELRFNA